MAKAAVLCIGTELTRGEVVNTNGNVLADALTRHGFEVTAVEIVDDDHERIVESLARLGRANAALVVTGGLGPTTDDITTEAAAARGAVQACRCRYSRGGSSYGMCSSASAQMCRAEWVAYSSTT